MVTLNWFVTLAFVVLGCLVHLNFAKAQSEVDLALVLSVDSSNSIDAEEQELQRQSFEEAFRSPRVHKAISDGADLINELGQVWERAADAGRHPWLAGLPQSGRAPQSDSHSRGCRPALREERKKAGSQTSCYWQHVP
jgi:hypothetical protein